MENLKGNQTCSSEFMRLVCINLTQGINSSLLSNAVSDTKEGFIYRKIKGAEVARSIYVTLIYPSDKDHKWVFCSNQIKNCLVTVQDVEVAQNVWGNNIASLNGKTTSEKLECSCQVSKEDPCRIDKFAQVSIPHMRYIFVNKIPFSLTLSRNIYFTVVNHLENCTVPEIFKAFKKVYQHYLHSGFGITTVHEDSEFGPLKVLIYSLRGGPLANLNTENEHVPDIKRRIRVAKERCRAIRHGLPFQRMPKLLTTHIVLNTVKILNFFPTKGRISDSLSPNTIISDDTVDFKKHLRLQL